MIPGNVVQFFNNLQVVQIILIIPYLFYSHKTMTEAQNKGNKLLSRLKKSLHIFDNKGDQVASFGTLYDEFIYICLISCYKNIAYLLFLCQTLWITATLVYRATESDQRATGS